MKTKKSAASSQPEKLVRRSEADISAYAKSPAAKKASALLQKNIQKHGLEPSAADLREIPESTDEELSKLFRPVKRPVTLRVDGDVLAWLKSKGGRYQTHMNQTLRSAMFAERNATSRAKK